MAAPELLLASQSPRRREMIKWLGLTFRITTASVDESPRENEIPMILASRLARTKAQAVNAPKNVWVLAADTIVDLDAAPLGKPTSPEEATTMLQHLRERKHQVHTGVTLFNPTTQHDITRRVTTDVWMRDYTDTELACYVASGDPMDKAGAYAIQNQDFHPVARVNRCYANVVGLPLCAVVALLQQWGTLIEMNMVALCHRRFGYRCPAPDRGQPL